MMHRLGERRDPAAEAVELAAVRIGAAERGEQDAVALRARRRADRARGRPGSGWCRRACRPPDSSLVRRDLAHPLRRAWPGSAAVWARRPPARRMSRSRGVSTHARGSARRSACSSTVTPRPAAERRRAVRRGAACRRARCRPRSAGSSNSSGDDAPVDEVGAVDAREALGDHRAHAEVQRREHRRLARGALAVDLAAHDDAARRRPSRGRRTSASTFLKRELGDGGHVGAEHQAPRCRTARCRRSRPCRRA